MDMITWKDIIEIICKTHEIKQKDIATMLRLSPSAISKIHRGHQSPSFSNSEIYNLIFDPSIILKEKNTAIRSYQNLIQTIDIHFPHVKKIMADHYEPIPELANQEEMDKAIMKIYKDYVMCLLSRARKGDYDTSSAERTSESSQQATDSEDSTTSNNVVLDISTETESSASSFTNGDASSAVGGGATLYVEDKYLCCRFCKEWDGRYDDKLGNCKVFKKLFPADGKQCKYYETDYGRVTEHKLFPDILNKWPYKCHLI